MKTSYARRILEWQSTLSHHFDRLLPAKYRIVGMEHFRNVLLPAYLQSGSVIYDVGGGSRPALSAQEKASIRARVVGVDIDEDELRKAPVGAYDEIVAADITRYDGRGDADLVICRATMEHVANTYEAMKSLASILKPGGRLLMVTPSRNAVFARLNLMLSENVKRKILFAIFPHKGLGHDGFPAFYDRCTPGDFKKMASDHGLNVDVIVPYYYSSYFSFFLPFFVLWRAWVLLFHLVRGDEAAEVFSMVCTKTTRQ